MSLRSRGSSLLETPAPPAGDILGLLFPTLLLAGPLPSFIICVPPARGTHSLQSPALRQSWSVCWPGRRCRCWCCHWRWWWLEVVWWWLQGKVSWWRLTLLYYNSFNDTFTNPRLTGYICCHCHISGNQGKEPTCCVDPICVELDCDSSAASHGAGGGVTVALGGGAVIDFHPVPAAIAEHIKCCECKCYRLPGC